MIEPDLHFRKMDQSAERRMGLWEGKERGKNRGSS